jgi:peptidoglycan/xylan/chitin deacetylase (PgdA/CDA1 family)
MTRRDAILLTGTGIASGIFGTINEDLAQATQCGPDISHGDRSKKKIALTFHGAGDAVIASEIYAIANSAKSRITVMAIGSWATSNQNLITSLLKDGHEVGNHTLSHKTMTRLTLKSALAEVSGGKSALAKVIGTSKTYFRPSGTPKSNATIRTAAANSGYRNCITYDVDSLDYQDPKPQKIIDKTLNDIQAGSIVSLHLGHKNTLAALPKLIQGIKDLGLEMVTLTDLLGKP